MKKFDLSPYRPVSIDDLIRIGKDNDGGYVVPIVAVRQSTSLLSLGVSLDWSFEQSMLDMQPGIKLLCVDGTTGLGRAVIKAFQKLFDFIAHLITLNFRRAKSDIGFILIPMKFYNFFSKYPLLKLMVGNSSRRGYINITQLIDKYFPSDDNVFLKIDIEGGEYEVLPLEKRVSEIVNCLVVEFHALEKNWEKFQEIMSSLMDDFYVAHIHGNNFQSYIPGTQVPEVLEITFINKKYFQSKPGSSDKLYPLEGLDMSCNAKHPDLVLSFDL